MSIHQFRYDDGIDLSESIKNKNINYWNNLNAISKEKFKET